MKKLNLVFVPGASPTCIPLGIASLFAYVKKTLGDVDVSMSDLSILLWNQLRGQSTGTNGNEPLPFADRDGFYIPDTYAAHWQRAAPIHGRWHQITRSISAALQRDENRVPDFYAAVMHHALKLDTTDVLALSAAYPEQLIHAAVIARLVKAQRPDVTVLLGGSALPSIHPDSLLNAVPQIDLLYLGEGEQGICEFLQDGPVHGRGWIGRFHGERESVKRPRAIPMQSLPVPGFSSFDLSRYWMPDPVLPVAFSRGCRWRKCAFCSHNFGFAGYRIDDCGRFVDHLAQLQSIHRTDYFYFTDQYIDAASLAGIANEILKQKLQLRFHVMGRPTSEYTRDILNLLFAAGCRWISWGVESGAQSLLDTCRKGTRVQDVAAVLENSHHAGINNLAMMVFGLPGTSPERFQQTLDFATSVSEWVAAFTDSSFQLFEQTPYFQNAASIGIVPGDNEVLFSIGDRQVISRRRAYAQQTGGGQMAPPSGAEEVALWKRWKTWVRGESFFETLPAEHYLLYADRMSGAPL